MQFPEERAIGDVEQLTEMAEWWKPKLGIADWALNLDILPMIDIHNQGMAESRTIIARRIAWIKLSRSGTRADGGVPDDMEQSLLHELLHVQFAAWHDYSDTHGQTSLEQDVCSEQSIDQLAETLVTLRRSSGHKFSFEEKGE